MTSNQQETLRRRWENVRYWLSGAAESLNECVPPQGSLSTRSANAMDAFHEYLDHNELGLALDALESVPTTTEVAAGFWLRLHLAAKCMDLRTRSEQLLRRYQKGTNCGDTLQAIRDSTLTELREQRLGVTEQFFDIHRLPDELKIFSCVEGRPDRTIGQSYVGVQNEPYYWVVQSELQPAGTWQAIWGYCSHRARVYLGIYHEHEPAESISNRLGMCPDKIVVKGLPRPPRPGARCFESHRWYLQSPAADYRDVKDRLEALLIAIEPFSDRLAELQADSGCHAAINTALYDSTEWAFGFGLDASTIARLAKAKLGVDFDMYHSGPLINDE